MLNKHEFSCCYCHASVKEQQGTIWSRGKGKGWSGCCKSCQETHPNQIAGRKKQKQLKDAKEAKASAKVAKTSQKIASPAEAKAYLATLGKDELIALLTS